MKKRFIFRTPLGGFTSVFFGEQTEEEKAALKLVKTEAQKAALEAYTNSIGQLFEAGMEKAEMEKVIKELAKSVYETMKLTDPADENEEKTIAEMFKAMQDQHNAFAQSFEEYKKQGGAAKNGIYVDFVKAQLAANPAIEKDAKYHATLIIKAAALMTTANVIPNVAGGFSPLFGNYIDEEIGHVPKPENIILPLITVINAPGTENIWFSDRINEEGDAEFIGEGDLKPLADAEWKTSKAPIKEVAVRWKFTKRLMNHAPSIVQDFLEHVNELVEQKIDDQLLDGDGLGDNLTGLLEVAGAFIVPPQLADYYEFANIWDVINAMASRIRLTNFKGNLTAVLNTVWEAKMMGIKDANGRYITPPFVSADGRKVGSVTIEFSNKIDDDTVLIGELKRFKLVIAENVTYDEGYENEDFSKNLVSRKLEAFMGTYIKASDAGSILADNISTVLELISVPVV
jgi:hypothetical protein